MYFNNFRCWIGNPVARLYYSYLFAWITFFIILCSYSFISYFLWKSSQAVDKYLDKKLQNKTQKNNKKVFKSLAAFPIVFLIQWIPATVNRIQNAVDPSNPITALYMVHIFFVTSSGMFYIIFYNKKTVTLLWNLIVHRTLGRSSSTATNSKPGHDIEITTEELSTSNSSVIIPTTTQVEIKLPQ